jgi:hypothetical protein
VPRVDAGTYAKRISFRIWGPDSANWQYWRLKAWLAKVGVSLEAWNTRLPEGRWETRKRLDHLLEVPRMSTFAMGALIDNAVRTMPADTSFVNVGVWHGFTFLSGIVGNRDRRCVGIDNFSEFHDPEFAGENHGNPKDEFLERFQQNSSPQHEFHEIDYEEYFERLHGAEPIGFYIYDGDHAYGHQLRGLEIADPYLVPGSHILVDDTNWDEPRQATVDFVNARKDHYEVVFDQRTRELVHPTFWNGVMLLRRR